MTGLTFFPFIAELGFRLEQEREPAFTLDADSGTINFHRPHFESVIPLYMLRITGGRLSRKFGPTFWPTK